MYKRQVSGPQVAFLKGAVHVVAVAALDEPFVHFVMERHIKLRLLVGMALVAERGLGGLQQVLLILALVNAVAAHATHILSLIHI